jgi:hypothetical protein
MPRSGNMRPCAETEKSMIKMQIIMDEEKIEREGRYDLDGIYAKLNGFLVKRLELNNAGNGFYEEVVFPARAGVIPG